MSTEPAASAPDSALPPLPWEAADIMTILPHRYPFLLIDRVVEIDPGQRVVAIRNVTANEPQFTGHFPGRPSCPVCWSSRWPRPGPWRSCQREQGQSRSAGIDEADSADRGPNMLRLEIPSKLGRVSPRASVATVEGEVAVEAPVVHHAPRPGHRWRTLTGG
jgi:3-hydroxyacyl-[acyl-carrier-protein] dehydratase